MLERITLNLSSNEKQALQIIAEMEMRGLRDQARYIIRDELERRGLLVENANHENQCQKVENEQ